jgi:hypothetical protein
MWILICHIVLHASCVQLALAKQLAAADSPASVTNGDNGDLLASHIEHASRLPGGSRATAVVAKYERL